MPETAVRSFQVHDPRANSGAVFVRGTSVTTPVGATSPQSTSVIIVTRRSDAAQLAIDASNDSSPDPRTLAVTDYTDSSFADNGTRVEGVTQAVVGTEQIFTPGGRITPIAFEIKSHNAALYLDSTPVTAFGGDASRLVAVSKEVTDKLTGGARGVAAIAGVYVYRGVHVAGSGHQLSWTNSLNSPSTRHVTPFSLAANFDTNSFFISGRERDVGTGTADRRFIDFTGSGTITQATGVLQSTSIRIASNLTQNADDNSGYIDNNGALYGRFGGANAQGVSGALVGLVKDLSQNPAPDVHWSGGFVGEQRAAVDISLLRTVTTLGHAGRITLKDINDAGVESATCANYPGAGDCTWSFAATGTVAHESIIQVLDILALQDSAFTNMSSADTTGSTYRQAAGVQIAGERSTVASWRSRASSAALYLWNETASSTTLVLAGGGAITGTLPLTGETTYRGDLVGGTPGALLSDPVDFSVTISWGGSGGAGHMYGFTATVAGRRLNADGTIDRAKGTFKSTSTNDFSTSISDSGDKDQIKVRGRFHGAATAVSGIFFTNGNFSENGSAATPLAGAFIADNAARNFFDLSTSAADGGIADIDGPAIPSGSPTTGTATYGSAVGTRHREGPQRIAGVTSEIIIVSPSVAGDARTATKAAGTAPNGVALDWLGAALEATAGATEDFARVDGTGAAKTFTSAYTGTGVIEYRTNRTTSGGAPFDVASLYLIDNAATDRIVVTGPDYVATSRTYVERQAGKTLSYAGRLTAPRLLADAFGAAHADTHRFTLDIVVAADRSATFDLAHSRSAGDTTSLFNIEDGAVDLASGRLTLGSAATRTVTDTVTDTAAGTSTTANLYKSGAGTFGLVGQIYGGEAEAVGGAYWGQANGSAASFEAGDEGKPFGGAFIASRSGIATTPPPVSYPLNTYVLSDDEDDIDRGVDAATYGAASGTRYFTLDASSGVTQSKIAILSSSITTDLSTASTSGGSNPQGANLAWLTTALGAIGSSAGPETARADSTDDDEKTFTTGYTATGAIEYRTNMTTGTAPNVTALDVASLYLIDNADADRIVVTGPDYDATASKTYLGTLGGQTLSYVGRLTAPQLLASAFGTAHADTHRFTLDIAVATGGTSATFGIRHTRRTGTDTTTTNVFDIEDGLVDLDTGRLTLGGSSTYTVTHKVGQNDAENLYGTDTGAFGLVGQIYGDAAEAVGGTYWGQALGGTNRAFSTDDNGKPFGGAFIASRSGIAATPVPVNYPLNFFDLATLTADIDGADGTAYGSAVGSRSRFAADGATGVASSVLILSPSAAADASTATIDTSTAPNGVALAWLGAALEATAGATAATARADGSGAAQTFTAGYTGTGVIEYRTNRTASGAALDVASLYLVDGTGATGDRIVVTGPDYDATASKTYLGSQGGQTLSYVGRLTAPQLLAGAFGTAHADTHRFTLDIVVATGGDSATFDIGHTRTTGTGTTTTNVFEIEDGEVDLDSGRLTLGGSSTYTVTRKVGDADAVNLYKTGTDTFGLVGQIYGDAAEAVGGTYWGQALGGDGLVFTRDEDGNPLGGAFIASFAGSATTVSYPINTYVLTHDEDDIDLTADIATYGAASGTRYFTLDASSGVTQSEIAILSNTAAGDVLTATAGSGTAAQGANLAWLTTALGAIDSSVTADGNRADSADDDEKTFTTGYSVTGVIEYRTSRAGLDVASLYLIDGTGGADDRIVVTGPDYAAQSYLSGLSGRTLSYAGRLTAPQLLTGAFGTAHADTHGFTLDIVVATATSATFNIGHTRTTGTGITTTSAFNIEGGAVDLGTGRLTIGGGTRTVTDTVRDTAAGTSVTANLYKAGVDTFGLVGQIYGDEAEAVGGTYWGQANGNAASFGNTDDGKPFGGAFIASRSGIASYPRNIFSLTAATGGNANADDIDVGAASTYGVGIGTRARTQSRRADAVDSEIIVITGGASTDFTTATNADLPWLSAALETGVTAATGRDDGVGAAQTFTTAHTGTNLIEYRTSRADLDVASLYLIDNAASDRIVVIGPDYGSETYLSGQDGMTLSYGGRLTAPQLLTGAGGTAHVDTHGFTLDIVVATATSATFNIGHTRTASDGTQSAFTIQGGAVNLGTGRLTLSTGTATLTDTPSGATAVALAQSGTFGLVGQIYGDEAEAVGGTYWGQANGSAASFQAGDAGNPFGGAFIASRSGIAATITYPQNVFSLTGTPDDIDGSSAASTYGVGIGTRTRTASAGNSVESDLIVITGDASNDFSTATNADLTWLSAALETSLTAATGRDDGSDDAQTFTAAYTGTNVIAYRTSRASLDVASLYLIDNAAADRIVVTGPDYAAETYLSGLNGSTLSYGGRLTAPQILTGAGGTAHADTHGFTLDIVVATTTSATFNIGHTRTASDGTQSAFTIQGGAVDLGTGRLTLGTGAATLTDTPSGAGATAVALAQSGTFGLVGQIYGDEAEAVGGTYWGLASQSAASFDDDDDGNPFGGAFIASRRGIAATITYPQNVFSLTGTPDDIDGSSAASTYGVGIGTRTRTASAGNSVESDLIVITGGASNDFSTATNADLTWLSAALETSLTAATGRDDGSDDAQTFTAAYTGTNVIAYRTNRSGLDVASLYLIDNAAADRIVVTGPDYAAETYLSGLNGSTLSYGGRLTAPQVLTGAGGTAHADTHGFTLDIVVATTTSATFNIGHTRTASDGTQSAFTIQGGAVDLGTGRLTLGTGAATLTDTPSGAGATAVALSQSGTFGLVGQIYGDEAEAVGGTYWGLASQSAASFDADDDGNPFGGAFIASRSGSAATITYPQNLFDLATVNADIDGANGTAYGSAAGSRYRVATDGATGATSRVIIISPNAAADARTATIDTDDAPNGVALAWLGAALEATAGANAAVGRADSANVAEKTFTAGYEASGVTEYRTNATTGGDSPTALDIASLYLIDNDAADRIAVTGPDYASKTYLTGKPGMTLSYTGLLSVPQLLGDVAGTTHANTRRFTLDLDVVDDTTATFELNHEQTVSNLTSKFIIEDGAVDLDTGRLTYVSGTSTATITEQVVADTDINVFNDNSFGLVGQIFGDTADALGGTYWGLGNQAAPLVSNDNNGKPFGGAFIGTRTGIAATPSAAAPAGGTNTFVLAQDDGDIDAAASGTYGAASGTHYFTPAGASSPVQSAVAILSGSATTDVSTASTAAGKTQGADVTWLGTALDTPLTADSARVDFPVRPDFVFGGPRPTDAADQTFTLGYTGDKVVAYQTNRGGDIAQALFIDDGDADRIVVSGPAYDAAASGGQSWLARRFADSSISNTFEYKGRVSLPSLLGAAADIGNDDTWSATLTITLAADSGTFTFAMDTRTRLSSGGRSSGEGSVAQTIFKIESGGTVNYTTGKLAASTVMAKETSQLAGESGPTPRQFFTSGSFGFTGQIYGAEAEAVGAIYWGVAAEATSFLAAADANKPIGGVFIGARESFPQNLFDLSRAAADGGANDIDGAAASTYGVGVGTRTRTASAGSSAESEIIVIAGDAGTDAATLAWLSPVLEASLTADTDRVDSTTAGSKTFTTGYSATGVIEYRTNRSGLDVASLYLVDNHAADRIVVTGPNYAAKGFIEGRAGKTLSYAGRLTAPQLLAGAHGTTHAATHRFTLDIAVASDSSATFDIGHTRTAGATTSAFNIEDGVVDLDTGRLTIGSGSTSTVTDTDTASSATANLFQDGTFGFAGQIYGTEAEAVGGTYWGRASQSAASVDHGR